jgi:hypothetical protein
MKAQASNRIIWLFGVLIVVSSLALFFFKVKEHFAAAPSKRPTAPSKRPTTPSKPPTTPSKRPTTPSKPPTTPPKRPTTPSKPPTTTAEIHGCDGKTMTKVDCPTGYKVDTAKLTYGRWANSGLCPKLKLTNKTIKQSKDYPIGSQYIQGRSVNLNKKPADIVGTSDPAPGAKKQWQVTAKCKLV